MDNSMDMMQQMMAKMQAMEQKLAETEAALAAAKAAKVTKLTWKVSEKGALSLYGLGRFPVTLYKEQWVRVANEGLPALKPFLSNLDMASVARIEAAEAATARASSRERGQAAIAERLQAHGM